ncbi:MAG: UDP-N-acetylglucosamine diphosphorylase/glucosamine-1-phosphate N-acetyltransferase [Oceanicoccus sp.]|uniref:bifunctional UDP-N-acetylglucosamine diphosphorylase/glucosamine-1-phosphate N-acetyltransferase GlmU n=1 Tax=Oceanicoccus sp. TaxID=2691044 RepID=UPI0026077EB2|nr:bifunctional UDP-N-acetylglucosamine diphosphorylase/glucosamine-1-phosphate N-acetyltransferase GlmU [Oceanicoccus sp.]MCP3908730.1 UDP-N-acetylglucosamine diphosphorylase/glucosamine-1-phosphate N-acetyltransferase [Oceanicoccus sp.]MDG1772177.1 bifunctional UDP-N-acetylglucosamine diphosphorylase/glucosamine-1-phosphate N-acetyltransferase GlmU [Oceanicoccus sp.]
MTTEVVILAAGKGTRMRSKLPKVLHQLAGKPMVGHVIDTAKKIQAGAIHVVIGHGAEQVQQNFADADLHWAIQSEQLGTGHAVAQAMPAVKADSIVLIAYGDVPLVTAETLSALVDAANENTLSLLTVYLDNPTGYGRIVRESGVITAIVEQKDASEEQLLINEVNTGILAVSAAKLNQWLPALSSNNAQGEYYLTDIIAMAVKDGMTVTAQHPQSAMEVEGANNRLQVAGLERFYQQQQAERLMTEGATLADPARIDIRGDLTIGQDIFIDVNCVFIGDVTIADDVTIGPNCVIENSTIGKGTVIKANSILENATVAENCDVGPFARLRPGSVLADKAKVGNFVETKKANIGEGSKVNHLTYIGDSNIGKGVNVGAGTITCNYDGVNKSTTNIGDGAFIGSNSSLVAPVNIGSNATVGAGSTISSDVADNQLGVARGKQKNLDSWKRPTKKS